MRIQHLSAYRFKILRDVSIEPAPKFNFLIGDNASGKTTLLDLIASIGRGKLVGGDARSVGHPRNAAWSAAARVGRIGASDAHASQTLRLSWDGESVATLNHQRTAAAEYVRILPTASVNVHSLILGHQGPSARRRFLDWQLFHVEPSYAALWSEWRRLLKQRNRAIASGASDQEVSAWTPALALKTEAISRLRTEVAEQLLKVSPELISILHLDGLKLRFAPGWDVTSSYEEALRGNLVLDRRVGRTRLGAHHADLKIRAWDQEVERLSRGQQKLLVVALTIAACQLIYSRTRRYPIFLLDDFEAELAPSAVHRIVQAAHSYPGQSFLTSHRIPPALKASADNTAMFHVEHGAVTRKLE